ncbi:hypothetical protein N8629_04695 [Akkermansiaceae bacterium]|nr:hypothetical protein [bacterium]MDA7655073.1 hypothetical protein [Akkermansiaceae bacterium]MDB4633279.1 hypothetical protein [Akkermansiaceae bacterium]
MVELFVPFESESGLALGSKVLLFGVFGALAIIGNRLLPTNLKRRKLRPPNNKTLWLLRLCSFLGPISLAVDRIYYRGVDISLGVTSMRYTMARESDGGVSSIFSVLGYTLSGLCFLLLVRLVIFTKYQSNKLNFLDLFLILFGVIGVSVLTGGRTTIFILVGILYGALFCKINLLKEGFRLRAKPILISLMITGLLFSYVNYIFHDRARLTGVGSAEYYGSIIQHLGGKEKESASLSDKGDFYIYSQITMAYLVHQFWILDNSLKMPNRLKTGDSTFVTWRTILSKTGVFEQPRPWTYSGFYIPLVGCFIYSLGYFFGVLSYILFILTFVYFSSFYLKKRPSLLSFFIFCTASYVLVISVFLPSTDVLMVPMMCIGVGFIYPMIRWISKLKI